MFNRNHYTEFSGLETCNEILYAIEVVTGVGLSENDGEMEKNSAYKLWMNGGREQEILEALPCENADEGEEVFWGAAGIFAEFDGEKWIMEKNF